jgi:hypothetical protein
MRCELPGHAKGHPALKVKGHPALSMLQIDMLMPGHIKCKAAKNKDTFQFSPTFRSCLPTTLVPVRTSRSGDFAMFSKI